MMLNLISGKGVNARLVLIAVLALASLGLAGCGKKPGHVDPPSSVSTDTFPHTYPDPATDPKP